MGEKFPNLMKTLIYASKFRELQVGKYKEILVISYSKCGKPKVKEKVLKAVREKQLITYKETAAMLAADLTELVETRKQWDDIFKC